MVLCNILADHLRSKDEEDLLNHFMHFLANKEKYIQKAKEDAKWVEQTYSIEKHLDNLISAYREIQYLK